MSNNNNNNSKRIKSSSSSNNNNNKDDDDNDDDEVIFLDTKSLSQTKPPPKSTTDLMYILYCIPKGDAGLIWASFIEKTRNKFPNTQHEYPTIHITLTGFFKFTQDSPEKLIEIFHEIFTSKNKDDEQQIPLPEVKPLIVNGGWMGIPISAKPLEKLSKLFKQKIEQLYPPKDKQHIVRVKNQLHASLAYGITISSELSNLAQEHFSYIQQPHEWNDWAIVLYQTQSVGEGYPLIWNELVETRLQKAIMKR
jgi:hypothetical protein